ncbi:MAG: hypothetical protein K6E39_00660 [Lachnospiraceae bacterium]|nr:hypothetical protein [Lachnospiraceae bacterium]
MNNKASRYLAGPYVVWIVGFIVIPLLTILYYGFTNDANAFTLSNLMEICRWENYRPLYRALMLSAASTIVCFLISVRRMYI